MRYRIGKGLTVNVWKDAWLPDKFTPYIETVCDEGLQETTVNCLLLDNQPKWDLNIINSVFNERDRNQILSIPLSKTKTEDTIMWVWDRKGDYTVKSAYMSMFIEDHAGIAPAVTDWRKVWGINVAAKVKKIVWRSLSNAIPVRMNLFCRNIDVEIFCPICRCGSEDVFHLLVSCSEVRKLWVASPIGDRSREVSNMVQWWNLVGRNRDKSSQAIAAYSLWCIWLNRNEVVWGKKSRSAVQIASQAMAMLEQWLTVHGQRKIMPETNTGDDVKKWRRPNRGRSKLNVDASVRQNMVGYGGILRDSDGQFMKAVQGSIIGRFDPFVAESIGLREVLSWIKNSGICNVEVETDSQLLAKAINAQSPDKSLAGMVIDDCRSYLSELPNCSVRFIRRSANKVAHELAKLAIDITDQEELLSIPNCIMDVFSADLS